ncbi:MAG: hypothetical protein EPO10_29690 [Reyranella sp.]|uniref:hypothetical protein n=1 Tax=Reyranella sp. TaxID=1929291 RepID=UPI00121899F8|nr:hypothetical protein [Reyranella sp.]TAJ97169.1 MAG: hypothetical protein EPO41_04025 [Reyranella sp.]TBR21556.1 MAG: hypothetical protein EPO10_29690 [Reyranella sp.]
MSKVYSVDIKVYATAYIKAESAEEALSIARGLKDGTLAADKAAYWSDVEISDRQLDDPDLPDVSLSPAMSIHGPDDDAVAYSDEDDDEVEA